MGKSSQGGVAKALLKQVKAAQAQEQAYWAATQNFKPLKWSGYKPTIEWEEYQTTKGVNMAEPTHTITSSGTAVTTGAYWWLDWGEHAQDYWTIDGELEHAMPILDDSLNAINQYVKGYGVGTPSPPKYGKLTHTTTPTKLFPISGTYKVKDSKGVGQEVKVEILDNSQAQEIIAMVHLPMVLVADLNQTEEWLRRAITAAANAAVQSVTTLDTFDRLLDDEQYRHVLRTIMHDYLKGRPDVALSLGLTQALQPATTPTLEDL